MAHDRPTNADNIVMRAVHDASGWRIQFSLMAGDVLLAMLEGDARYVNEELCRQHGHMMWQAISHIIGLGPHDHSTNEGN